jgi:hypothetical protein
MQVAYHLGVQSTDEERLLKCLLKNKGALAAEGIHVPGPGKYRTLLREAMVSLRGAPASPEMQKSLLDAVLDDNQAERLVFSNQSFISAPAKVLEHGRLYARAGEKTQWLSQVLPEAEYSFFIAIRNPATFIPAVFGRVEQIAFDEFMGGADPTSLCWSEVIADIAEANPGVPLTVWCNEDTPLIWSEVLQALSGHSPELELKGSLDFPASIMTDTGTTRMQAYLQSHPPANAVQRRRILAAFLDKFAIPDEVEMELDLPGWTEALVEDMTERYEEDIFAIERMPDVTFIAP